MLCWESEFPRAFSAECLEGLGVAVVTEEDPIDKVADEMGADVSYWLLSCAICSGG